MNDSHRSSMPKRSSKVTSAVRMRLVAGVAAMVGFSIAAATMASCTVDDGAQPRGNTMGAGGGYSGNVNNVDPNAPCNAGATIECHQTIGKNDDILTCLHGEKTCVNGSWGPCVGAFSSRADWHPTSSASATNNPDEAHILGLSDAGPCENNPCDPYCQDYEEVPGADAGYQVVPQITTVWTAGSFDDLLDGLPPGFVNKGIKNPCTTSADCQFDSHCLPTGTNGITCADNAAKCCMAWNPLEYAMCNPARPDVSLGLACIRRDGKKVVPVCNRGNAPIVPPVRLYVFPGNSTQFPTCTPDNNPDVCLIPAGSPSIQPGRCVEVTSCHNFFPGNGIKTVQANGPQNGPGNLPDNPDYFQECACENNWTVWKGTNDSPCQPVQVYQANPIVRNITYQGICPAGTRVQWQYLTWDTTTPGDSNVVWDARVATTSGGLSSATYTNLGKAKATPAPDNHICSMTSPTGCPINVFNTISTAFGEPATHSEFLELRVTMNPTTNMQQGSRVNNWLISYTCPRTL